VRATLALPCNMLDSCSARAGCSHQQHALCVQPLDNPALSFLHARADPIAAATGCRSCCRRDGGGMCHHSLCHRRHERFDTVLDDSKLCTTELLSACSLCSSCRLLTAVLCKHRRYPVHTRLFDHPGEHIPIVELSRMQPPNTRCRILISGSIPIADRWLRHQGPHERMG